MLIYSQDESERVVVLQLLLSEQREVDRQVIAAVGRIVVPLKRNQGSTSVTGLKFALVASIMCLPVSVVTFLVV